MAPLDESTLSVTQLSRYTIGELIGSGGMGRVYRARDERLKRDVAIKVPRRRGATGCRHELVTEARALSRLCHPHVAAIFDLLADDERDLIVMEYVRGETLKEILGRGALPFADVLRLGRQMVQGLAAVHAGDVVHRDIKPANLKVTSEGNLKILDFGLAHLLPSASLQEMSTRSRTDFSMAGTMPYMSPEQVRGECTDERSDIFSAGAVLYEMATGTQAFPQLNMAQLVDAILYRTVAAPSRINPSVPSSFDDVVEKAMEKRWSKRYDSARALDTALAGLEAGSLSPRPPLISWIAGLAQSWWKATRVIANTVGAQQ